MDTCKDQRITEKNNNVSNIDEAELESNEPNALVMDVVWIEKLHKLIREANILQYQTAYLSTLGGAFHLSNNPRQALFIAIRQEHIAKCIGSTAALVRSKLYQYINLSSLKQFKKSKIIFNDARKIANSSKNVKLIELCDCTEQWLNGLIEHRGEEKKCSAQFDSMNISQTNCKEHSDFNSMSDYSS